MKIRYKARDEDELLELIDKDPHKFDGWEGPIKVHLRSIMYPKKIEQNMWMIDEEEPKNGD